MLLLLQELSMDIRDTAAKYLAFRARSSGELRSHLKSKGFCSDEISQVIADFTDYGYLDDEDYCRQYIRYARSKGKGPLRIKQELSEKGIGRDIIQIAMEDDDCDDFEQALNQAVKTMAGKPMDEKMRGRVGRRLTSLGYSMDIVYKVLGRLSGNYDE